MPIGRDKSLDSLNQLRKFSALQEEGLPDLAGSSHVHSKGHSALILLLIPITTDRAGVFKIKPMDFGYTKLPLLQF